MFGIFKRKETIQSIAHQVPNVLLREFGDKNSYSPDEVDKALLELGHEKHRDMTRYQYAYGMFTSLASYEQLGLTQELGNYGHFQREVGKMLLNTPEPIDMHIYFELAQQHHLSGGQANVGNEANVVDSVDGGY
ncbi:MULTISPECIES: hypothetical protein [Vibrio]|jgi:hypothetical protein|uniref:Uncharacterized protein n=2 Tax=Vibrio harveyi TaxID=669 RepID=K5U0P0_VIBHA|nr:MULTISPECIES: hypothetical protein [Vibrio]AIV05437.1 hypothetical protein LA59_08100 [Vibrio harveyi]AMF99260.1 hypothetical protein AL538_16755 [Vibrio harveyi]AWB00636.1 hypothetical protein CU052_15665 [Vibrio harveyi]EKM14474.1 hypothetical protein VCHENC01_0951 [Vibrio harveyi]EKO3785976.1 hypothetical protein [Vibrio harveyi]